MERIRFADSIAALAVAVAVAAVVALVVVFGAEYAAEWVMTFVTDNEKKLVVAGVAGIVVVGRMQPMALESELKSKPKLVLKGVAGRAEDY